MKIAEIANKPLQYGDLVEMVDPTSRFAGIKKPVSIMQDALKRHESTRTS